MARAVTVNGWLLAAALRDPAGTATLGADGWQALLAIARAEQLIGSLAHRLRGLPIPAAVACASSTTASPRPTREGWRHCGRRKWRGACWRRSVARSCC